MNIFRLIAIFCCLPFLLVGPANSQEKDSASRDGKQAVEIVIKSKEPWFYKDFTHRTDGPEDKSFSWSHTTQDYPPLSARDALFLAEAAKDSILEKVKDHDLGVRLESAALRPVAKDAWVWVISYRLVSTRGIPFVGSPGAIEIPVLMTGRIPDGNGIDIDYESAGEKVPSKLKNEPRNSSQAGDSQEKKGAGEPKSDSIPKVPSDSETSGGRESDDLRISYRKMDPLQIIANHPAMYFGNVKFSTLTLADLLRSPRWQKKDQNPPLPARVALKIANDELNKYRIQVAAPVEDFELSQLKLLRYLNDWYWVAEYKVDNHGQRNFDNDLEIPILFDGSVPKFEADE